MTLDIEFVRSQFPAFREPSLRGFAHFENAGGSYAAGQTIAWLERYYRETKLQPYYAFAPSARAGEQMDAARSRMAAWLNVGVDEMHFGPSTSQNTYVLAQALRRYLKPGDEVIVTNQEHEANVGAYARLADDGITVREWKVNPDTAELERRDLEALLGPRTKVVAFTHCSNLVGSINAVREFTGLVHRAGAWAFVDGVAFAPHGLPDIAELGVDAYCFSLYKVYGPHLGAMYLRREVNAALPNQGHFFNEGKPHARFTPAGPDHAQIAAVNGVMDYLDAIADRHGRQGQPQAARSAAVRSLFRAHETALLQPLLDWLAGHPKVRLIGRRRAAERAPTVSIVVEGRPSAGVGARLADAGIGVGVGNFYAYRVFRALGLDPEDGAVRLSFVHYTTRGEVEKLMQELDRCLS
jgi:cysteine desulfurase family protein (TIGR01976 family)